MNRLRELIGWVVLIALTTSFAVALGKACSEAASPEGAGDDNFRLGLAQWEKGDFDEAIVSLTKAIQKHPGETNLLVTRGLVYYDQNDLDRAVADFTSVLQHDKNNSRALCGRARAYYEQGKLDKAMNDVTHVLVMHPNVAGQKLIFNVAPGKPAAPAKGRDEAPEDPGEKRAAASDDPFLSLLPTAAPPGGQTQAAAHDLDSERRAAAGRLSAQNRARALQRIRANQQQDQKNLQGILTRSNSHR
jgi:tetratricopeptide (TPR) repeat protein